eukprot:358619-Chlamydomonas_euryale.AAC.13
MRDDEFAAGPDVPVAGGLLLQHTATAEARPTRHARTPLHSRTRTCSSSAEGGRLLLRWRNGPACSRLPRGQAASRPPPPWRATGRGVLCRDGVGRGTASGTDSFAQHTVDPPDIERGRPE